MKQDTFTRLPNDLLESLYQMKLSGSDFRVALFIIRYTYGFHRTVAKLTASFVAKGTGLSQRSVERSLSKLNHTDSFAKKSDRFVSIVRQICRDNSDSFDGQENKDKKENSRKKEEESDDNISEDNQSIDESTPNKHTGYRF